MSTRALSRFARVAPIPWLLAAAGCVTTDVDPADETGGASAMGADPSAGGATAGGATAGGATAGWPSTGSVDQAAAAGGASVAPASSAVYRCEDPGVPKFKSPGTSPLIVDFETGALGAPSETGEA